VTSLRALVGGLPPTFWYLWTGLLVNRATGFIVPFLALWLTRERGFTAARAGLVVALYGAGAIVAGFAGGAMADRVGRRFTLLFGLLGSAAAVLAIAASPLAALPPLVLLAGFFGEVYRPPILACVADVVPLPERERAYSLTYWSVNLGFAVGGMVAGLLASVSYVAMFLGDAVTTLAFAGIVALKVPETLSAPAARGHPLRDAAEGFGRTFRDRHFTVLLVLQLAILLVFVQVHVAVPLDMAAKGIGPAGFGALISLNGVLIGVVQPFAPSFLARFDRGRVLAVSALLVGTGFGLHALAETPTAFAAAIAVWTFGEIANFPVSTAIISELAPADLRGRYQGAFGITLSVAAFLAPMFGPALLAHLGPRVFWGGCFAVGAATFAGHLAAAGPRRDRLAELRAARAGDPMRAP
jgi:MFS family permease